MNQPQGNDGSNPLNESRYNPYQSESFGNDVPEPSQGFSNDKPREEYRFDGSNPNPYSFSTKEEYERYLSSPPVLEPQTPIIAILAAIFAFVFAPVGFALGIIGLSQSKRTNNQTGRILSWIGIGVGGAQVLAVILVFMLVIVAMLSY